MIEVKIPKEIRDYKETFIFGLTLRQTIAVVCAVAVSTPFYIFFMDSLGKSVVGWISIFLSAPFVLFGFFKYNGMNFEKMPELSWKYGYLFTLSLMLLSTWLPYKYFKYRKWF